MDREYTPTVYTHKVTHKIDQELVLKTEVQEMLLKEAIERVLYKCPRDSVQLSF